jgi:hypothetical protein
VVALIGGRLASFSTPCIEKFYTTIFDFVQDIYRTFDAMVANICIGNCLKPLENQ